MLVCKHGSSTSYFCFHLCMCVYVCVKVHLNTSIQVPPPQHFKLKISYYHNIFLNVQVQVLVLSVTLHDHYRCVYVCMVVVEGDIYMYIMNVCLLLTAAVEEETLRQYIP